MPRPILMDTDVMVDFLRGHPKAVAFVKAEKNRIVFPSILVAELYAGVRNAEEMAVLDALVSMFRVVPLSAAIAQAAGLHKKHYAKSHALGLAAAIVAATAEAENAELCTLNTKHYPMFKGLKPPYAKA